MAKSSQHQALVKYFLKPYPIHFKNISQMKTYVKILSEYFSARCSRGRSRSLTSSKASAQELAMIIRTIKVSNQECSMIR